ncbi:MAG TPA: ThuA domain-containing protein [Rhizomicrobium sp.]|nr:ThuA domain-containing protein [Rhizomicrobium sp.]
MTDKKGKDGKKLNLSRRGMFTIAAGAAASLPLTAQGQPAQTPPAQDPPKPAPARRDRQGGAGPLNVLFISKHHSFDRENLFLALDSMGTTITWTHVEQPAAEAFYDPRLAEPYDVLLFYDAFAGRKFTLNPDGTVSNVDTPPSAQTQANLKALLQAGNKGFVFFHHALSSWAHTWPAGLNGSNAYSEVMGGAADWGKTIHNVRGRDYQASGALGGTKQRITVVDKNHPVTQGLEDFDLVDETYLCPIFEDSVHPLLRTDFKPVDTAFVGRERTQGHPPGSNLTGWVKVAERSPVVYIQHGHDARAWENPSWRKLMLNAIRWAASPESKTWAKANEKRIFR